MTEIQKIEKVCAELGINEKEMCKEIGINYSTLWRYYKGKMKTSDVIIKKINKYLGIDKDSKTICLIKEQVCYGFKQNKITVEQLNDSMELLKKLE